MKKLIWIGGFALLAACGSSSDGVSVGTQSDDTTLASPPPLASTTPSSNSTAGSVDDTATSVEGSGDTISINDFSEMPPQCIELLGRFLKKIEPTASQIDWDTATVSEFEDFEKQFQADSDSFDAESTAAGCDKYNLTGSDDKQFEQMAALAATEAPGALGFINFLKSLSQSGTATGDVPSDCPGTIAAIEPFLAKGETMRDLTLADVTRLGQLMSAVSTNCTSEEASAFFARTDVTDFINA
jgi:hypothetical protein